MHSSSELDCLQDLDTCGLPLAAADGELDKLSRYDDSVAPLAFESYGRLGRRSQFELKSIANVVASTECTARRVTGVGLYAQWRWELERVLAVRCVSALATEHTMWLLHIQLCAMHSTFRHASKSCGTLNFSVCIPHSISRYAVTFFVHLQTVSCGQ